jgi:hypothetical protein
MIPPLPRIPLARRTVGRQAPFSHGESGKSLIVRDPGDAMVEMKSTGMRFSSFRKNIRACRDWSIKKLSLRVSGQTVAEFLCLYVPEPRHYLSEFVALDLHANRC